MLKLNPVDLQLLTIAIKNNFICNEQKVYGKRLSTDKAQYNGTLICFYEQRLSEKEYINKQMNEHKDREFENKQSNLDYFKLGNKHIL